MQRSFHAPPEEGSPGPTVAATAETRLFMSGIPISAAPLLLPALDGPGKVIVEAPVKKELVGKHLSGLSQPGFRFQSAGWCGRRFFHGGETGGRVPVGSGRSAAESVFISAGVITDPRRSAAAADSGCRRAQEQPPRQFDDPW